jgi:hypothetical protein
MRRGFARTLAGLLSAFVVCAGSICACSNDDAAPPQARDAGGDARSFPAADGSIAIGDAGGGGDGGEVESGVEASAGDSGVDAGPPPIGGCTTFVDHTADLEVDLPWALGTIEAAPDHCSMIKAGSVVKWTGSFTTHPLDAHGGDTPNPIAGAYMDAGGAGGSDVLIAFPDPGTFGYYCDVHLTAMQGAIKVVP